MTKLEDFSLPIQSIDTKKCLEQIFSSSRSLSGRRWCRSNRRRAASPCTSRRTKSAGIESKSCPIFAEKRRTKKCDLTSHLLLTTAVYSHSPILPPVPIPLMMSFGCRTFWKALTRWKAGEAGCPLALDRWIGVPWPPNDIPTNVAEMTNTTLSMLNHRRGALY